MAGIYTVTITNENQCPGIVKVNLKVIYTNKSKTMVASEEQAIDIRTDKTGTIYPNPTNDLIYFDTESKSLIEYIIYDMSGNIRTLKNTTGDGYISTSHLTSGIYQIRWKSEGSEEWITNKFVKIK